MLITKTFEDVPTKKAQGPMRVFIISPVVPDYPHARFPGVVVFSEIYQVTGPVERFAGQIASQGYVVACPSIYHEFCGPEPIPYDVKGTDDGNYWKAQKTLAAYDEDTELTISLLKSQSNCNGRIAATGMCLGGHLAFRAAFDKRILATVCFFATDLHSRTLGKRGIKPSDDSLERGDKHGDDSLERVEDYIQKEKETREKGEEGGKEDPPIKGELVMIFGKQDTHVPRQGRDQIRTTLEEARITASFLEVQAQHAFIRDESSKGRWDAALTRSLFGFMMEVFERTVGRDLGRRVESGEAPEHVC